MREETEVVNALKQLGLTEYEARCFVALAQLPHGTAKEIGQVADIPRSRVYETMDKLQNKGLVELHEAEPREYQSVSVDTALELLRNEYESYFDTVEQTLRQLQPTYKKNTQGVWAINNHDQVTGRVVDLLSDANDEIVFIVLDEDLFDDDVLDCLAEAGERNVAIHISTIADSIRARVENAGIDAQVFTSDLIRWFTAMEGSPRIGRLLMIDREPVLVSAIHEEELPGVPNETAVWTDGVNHGFATFAEQVLTYDLEENVAETDSTGSNTV